jgi:hypothetical protein
MDRLAWSGALLRSEISCRSFSANTANKWSMKGSASRAKVGHDERYPLLHQTGDERDVTGKPIQLRSQDKRFGGPGRSQGRDHQGQIVRR